MAAPTYRLFYSPGACSLAPHIVLEELGVPYETTRVLVNDGEGRAPTYLAINPRGRVPALVIRDETGERVLTEAMAIMVYLAQSHPEAGLLPVEPERFARLLEWMSWLGSTMHQTGMRTIIRPERFTKDAAGVPAIVAQGKELFADGLAQIEQRLPVQGHAMGEQFSILDAYLLVFYRWGNRVGFEVRDQFPRFAAAMDRVRARRAVAGSGAGAESSGCGGGAGGD
jgi:glutathione S-transferase